MTKNNNEILWIKRPTKSRLIDMKGRKTFDNLINDLIDNSERDIRPKKERQKNFWGKL